MLTLCFVTLLTLVSLDLTTSHPAHHIRLHHRHHVQHLVPQPVDMDPLRMSQNEIDKMYQQLSDYVHRTMNLGLITKKAEPSEYYESERRRYLNGKKASDAFSITMNLALNKNLP
ncbi:hypothetical protein QR680_019350 [Steinernema hermaphroditum]|uniref:Uncharacterized protein n=1 Tax=Steinernema hermaphroditum TaxID=289476 RepID=A0AA39GPL6_9BILA|nr:hypothetical protein QR680_019350 [Steinernema hermaphroditum]